MPVKVSYFLDVTSSWCFWVEPVWAELREVYAGRVDFNWKLALMDASGLPVSRAQCDWFYRRSGTIMRSPFMLNRGWYEAGVKEYLAPNLVAEAAKDFGITDDRVRLALARAGVIDGRKIGHWQEAVTIGAEAAGLDASALREKAESEAVLQRAKADTAEYHAMKATQRPTFVLENVIGDRVMFSGVVAYAPLAASLDAMLSDASAYASYAVHHGGPPAA